MTPFIIQDWAGNKMSFNPKSSVTKTFESFESAEEFLAEFIENSGKDYDEERGEYWIAEE